MNATLKHQRRLGRPQQASLNEKADRTSSDVARQRDNAPGSYGRGVYAEHATYTLNFRAQGSYGRGIYAGRSTADHDYDTQGSYGRGVYASHSTADLDFGAQGSFASGA